MRAPNRMALNREGIAAPEKMKRLTALAHANSHYTRPQCVTSLRGIGRDPLATMLQWYEGTQAGLQSNRGKTRSGMTHRGDSAAQIT